MSKCTTSITKAMKRRTKTWWSTSSCFTTPRLSTTRDTMKAPSMRPPYGVMTTNRLVYVWLRDVNLFWSFSDVTDWNCNPCEKWAPAINRQRPSNQVHQQAGRDGHPRLDGVLCSPFGAPGVFDQESRWGVQSLLQVRSEWVGGRIFGFSRFILLVVGACSLCYVFIRLWRFG